MLVLSRKIEEGLKIGDNIEIRVLDVFSMDKTDGRPVKSASIGIRAPKEISILRKELKQTMQENIEADKTVRNLTGSGLAGMLKTKKTLHLPEHNEKEQR